MSDGQMLNFPGRNGNPANAASLQVPLVCPGRKVDDQVVQACGTNVFEIITVGLYTRHRLKQQDRSFDKAVPVGTRFRCIACGHVLDQQDFNREF